MVGGLFEGSLYQSYTGPTADAFTPPAVRVLFASPHEATGPAGVTEIALPVAAIEYVLNTITLEVYTVVPTVTLHQKDSCPVPPGAAYVLDVAPEIAPLELYH